MKEDILEQLAENYLEAQGYFTISNVKFRPAPSEPGYDSRQDSVHSDIDVLGFNPRLLPPKRVVAVSCKSLQEGFFPEWELKAIADDTRIVGGREAWRRFRELCKPKWANAFRKAVFDRTGETEFEYITAVTHLRGAREAWEQHSGFQEVLRAPIRVVTLQDMVDVVLRGITTTVTSSELGRMLQLFKAAHIKLGAA